MLKKIHILGAGRWQVPTIRMAKELGVKVLATDRNSEAEGFSLADYHEAVDITDSEGTLKIARKYDIDGIMPTSDFGVRTAAYVAENLDLVGLKPETAVIAVDKGLFFEYFKKAGVPIPETRNVVNYDEGKVFAEEHGFPLLFKPVDNMGASRGIKRIDNMEELRDGYDYAMSFSKVKKLIVQEYVRGIEHNIESISYKGDTEVLTISDKIFPPFDYQYYNVETLNYPSIFSPDIKDRITKAIKKAVGAIGVTLGPTHAEAIHNEEGPFIIDIGARGGGGHIFSLIVNHVSGINAVQESVKIFLGEQPGNLKPQVQRGAVYRFFQCFTAGKVKKISGVLEAKKMKNVADLEIQVEPGQILQPLKTSTQRIGFAVITADTREEAEEISNKVANIVQIDIEPLIKNEAIV